MEASTGFANTKDWIEVSKNMTITAYVEQGVLSRIVEDGPKETVEQGGVFTRQEFFDALKKVSGVIDDEVQSSDIKAKLRSELGDRR